MTEAQNDNLTKLEKYRFRIPEHSQDVLHKFRKEMTAFIQSHPEVVGATIYGSQIKGTARVETDSTRKSDTDAFLFVEESVAGLQEEVNSGVSATTDSENWKVINQSVGKPFRELFAQTAGYTDSEVKDVRVRLLSKSRIDVDIGSMSSYLTKLAQFESGQSEVRPTLDERPIPDLARLFHLQLGQQLDSYRSYVLSELNKLGSVGDQIWEEFFFKDTLAQENAKLVKGFGDDAVEFQRKRSLLFPHTVEDALKFFKLEETLPKYSA